MKMNRTLWFLFFACTPLASLQANLLVNGDFNTGDFTGWWTWAADSANQSGAIEPATGYSFNGTPNAKLSSATSTWQMTLGQEVALAAGSTYKFSFFYSARPTTWGSAGVSIDYSDAGWGWLNYEWIPLYQQGPALNGDGDWLAYSGTFTAPAGTAFASLKFKVADWTTVHFDNVDLSVIPEPTTLILLGLGGMVLRRKSA